MFANTITITINNVDKTLTRINQDGYASEYFLREDAGEFRMRVRHSSYLDKTRKMIRVDRHNVELIQTQFPAVAGDPSTTRKWYTVFENDIGDAILNSSKFVVGAIGFLSEPNVVKMLNWES